MSELMTPEQKFFFDLRGWILLPAVLSQAEIDEMKAEVYAGAGRAIAARFKTCSTIRPSRASLPRFCRKLLLCGMIVTVSGAKGLLPLCGGPVGAHLNGATMACRMWCVRPNRQTPCAIRLRAKKYSLA